MRATTLSLLLLALAPSALAEEATTIGFEDASLDAMPPPYAAIADLVGGTIAVSGTNLAVTIELASLPELTPGLAYIMIFSNGTADWWAGVITIPGPVYAYGRWSTDDESPDTMEDAGGTYTTGSPGVVTVEFPYASLGTDVVSQPRGYAADIKGGAPSIIVPFELPFVVVDRAEGQGELRLPANENATAEEGTATPEEPASAASDETPAAAAPSPASAPSAVPGFGLPIALAALVCALGLLGRRPSRPG